MAAHIAILGAGSLGALYAGLLAEAGSCSVTLIARPRHLQTLRSTGITVQDPDGEERLVPAARFRTVVGLDEVDRPVDVLLVTPKAPSLPAALDTVKRPPVDAVLPLQNGVDHLPILDATFGPRSVLGGTTLEGAELLGPGRVRRLVAACTFLGERDGRRTSRVARLAELLSGAGLQSEVSTRIEAAMWTKLVHSCASTGVCGATRLGYTAALRSRTGAQLYRELVCEGLAVLEAAGIEPDEHLLRWVGLTSIATEPVETAVMQLQAEAERLAGRGFVGGTSLLRDLEAGRPSEVHHILGAMVRRADELGRPCPTTRAIYLAIATADQAS